MKDQKRKAKKSFCILNNIRDNYWGKLNLSEQNWIDDVLCFSSLTFQQKIELWRIRNKLDI